MIEKPGRFLTTVQIGITFAGFLASATAAVTLAEPLAEPLTALLERVGGRTLAGLGEPLAVVAVTGLLSYLSLVLGELVPKQWALRHAEAVAFAVVRPLQGLYRLVYPAAWLLEVSTQTILRWLGGPIGSDGVVTEEEIKVLLAASEAAGVVEPQERDMIESVFAFTDTKVRQVMVPRPDMVCVEADTPAEALLRLAAETGYSRLPVYEDTLDHIVGFVHVKDVALRAAEGQPVAPLRDYLRPAYFVPESVGVADLLTALRRRKAHLAIVVDEHGGTAGLVTLEDLLEEVVGHIEDEHDRPEDETFVRLDERTVLVDGLATRAEVQEQLSLELPPGPYETLAGFLLVQLGYLPSGGERAVWNGQTFIVEEMEKHRIARVRIITPEAGVNGVWEAGKRKRDE